MKRVVFIAILLFPVICTTAQEVDLKGLNVFLSELQAVESGHVEVESPGFEDLLCEISEQAYSDFDFDTDKFPIKLALKDMNSSDCEFMKITSRDKVGYKAVYDILDKYNVTDTEDLFGIPLMANTREDGEQQIVFIGEEHTFMVHDEGEDVEILYAGFNLIEVMKSMLMSMMERADVLFADKESAGAMDFTVSLNAMNLNWSEGGIPINIIDSATKVHVEPEAPIGASVYDIMAFAEELYEWKIKEYKTDGNELIEEDIEFLDELHEEMEDLREELNGLYAPAFVEIPFTGNFLVAIPEVSSDLRNRMLPSAKKGVYDWINGTGFAKGASIDNDQISCIITPEDVAFQYMLMNCPREKWSFEVSPTLCDIYALKYQGGTPAVLYRFSQNENGYNDMLDDLGNLFNLEIGDMYWDLEVTQQCKRSNGKRFVQLQNVDGVQMCLFDSPDDKYCLMSIIIGVSDFRHAVNAFIVGGETEIAKKCNIIINDKFDNNSLGIHFTSDEYFFAGKKNRNGVHVDFDYVRKYNN